MAAVLALPPAAAPARRPSVATAAASAPGLLLGQRPFLASYASCFAAERAAVARPAAGVLRSRTRRPRLSAGAIADNYPIVEVGITPKDEADIDKMANGLTKLAQEIPPLQFSRDDMTLIKGTGELDLDILVDRLKTEFEVEVNVGYPQVVYREIISKTVEARDVYKLDGTDPRFADVTLRIEPMERGSGYEFKSEIKGGAMTKDYVEEVMRGIEYTLPNGMLAECPVVDLRVVLVAGSYRSVHAKTFRVAARLALLKGLREAGPRLVEPVMRVEVITSGEHLDDVVNSLTYAGGEPESIEEKPGDLKVVEALVPLASMFEYASTLNGLSKGHASYRMQLAKFVDVPEHIQKQISRERSSWERPRSHLSVAIADNYPIVKVAIEPKDKADADKMANGLTKLAQEIASIQFSRGYGTSTFIEGTTGELHLDIIVDRLKREFKVEVNVGYPQVVYREIVSKTVEAQNVYKLSGKYPIFAGVTQRIDPMNFFSEIVEVQHVYKQSGTGPRFADVTLRIEPMERGSGYEFKSEIKGGAMTKDYVEEVMRGIEYTLPNGILAECPVVDLRVVLVAGSYRSVHANTFRVAARFALLKGLREAGPRLVEPVMRVEVRTPEYLDNITAHLISARGQVESIEEKPGELKVVEAVVPLSNMFEFASTLNLLSEGRASYTMQFAKFVTVPQHIQDRVSRQARVD